MDEFYDIVAAQRSDPEFNRLCELSAGNLQRRLISEENESENPAPGSMSGDHPVFQVTLSSTGQLSIGYSHQISVEAILDLLDHVRDVIEQQEDDF